MHTIELNRRFSLLGTEMPSAEVDHRNTLIMNRMRFKKRRWVRRVLSLGCLSMWNGLVVATSHDTIIVSLRYEEIRSTHCCIPLKELSFLLNQHEYGILMEYVNNYFSMLPSE